MSFDSLGLDAKILKALQEQTLHSAHPHSTASHSGNLIGKRPHGKCTNGHR